MSDADNAPEPLPLREEVIELRTNYDPIASENAGTLIDASGHPFGARRAELFQSATLDELIVAMERLRERRDHLDQVEEDWKRLYDLAWTTPGEVSDRFIDSLCAIGLMPGQQPKAGDVPAVDLMRHLRGRISAFTAIFSQVILPNLGDHEDAEAREILVRLGADTADSQVALDDGAATAWRGAESVLLRETVGRLTHMLAAYRKSPAEVTAEVVGRMPEPDRSAAQDLIARLKLLLAPWLRDDDEEGAVDDSELPDFPVE